MEIVKIASQYKIKLAQVFSKTYKDLLELNSMLFVYTNAIDIYDDQTVASAIKDASHNVAIAAQRAYDTGISASDLGYLLNKAKTKLMLVSSLGEQLDQDTKRMVSTVLNKLTSFVSIDIPQQKPTPKVNTQPADTDWSTLKDQIAKSYQTESEPYKNEEEPKSDFTLFQGGLTD